ncbi:MAG: ATP-binding protein [Synergistaceae bacterium]|nr:ATP-binding protein [Synergistaceae bacterium]
MNKNTLPIENDVEKELERLSRENKKMSRQLAIAHDTLDRIKRSSKVTATLSAMIADEKFNQDIFFNLILRHSPNIILIMDENGRFLYCGDSFLKKAGISNFGLISGRGFSKVFKNFLNAAEIRTLNSAMGKSIEEKRSVTLDMTIDFSKKGDPRSFFINFTPMDNSSGDTIGVMAMFHDMTDFLHAQQSEAASRAKSAFLTTMSHEILTPLNAIIGLSEVELQNNLPKNTRQNIDTIYNAGSSLLDIVNNILDISKIESGSFELLPFNYDVSSLINDTVQLNITRIGGKDLSFELFIDDTIPGYLYGDKLRITHILNNLLSNAFKYTEKGKISFRVEWKQTDGDADITFTVSDTGCGIEKKDMEKIFSGYGQLDTLAKRHDEGAGLGLSITKKLVDLMNGTISVESELGRGSVFTVEIRQKIVRNVPMGKEMAEELMHFHFMEKRKTRSKNFIRSYMPYGKVLVVDDVPTNLDVAKGLMLPYGVTVDFADSGKEAIEIIREKKTLYDIVFMDYMMPGMDGMEAVAVIRNDLGTEYARTVPIVALTANALVGNREIFLARGFDDFMAKPIDTMKLDIVLNQWVRDTQDEETLRLAEQAKAQMMEGSKSPDAPRVLEKMSVSGVNLAAGMERYSDETIYLGVLRSFVNHTPGLLSILRNLREENLTEYAITVHGIKGSAYGICANEAGGRAEALERAAKAGDFEAVRVSNEAFLALVETLIADLAELLRKAAEASGANKPKERLPAPDKALLRKLLEAAEHFKSSQMEEAMNELELYEYETDGELVTWLREQMESLEYDAIKKRLGKLN